MAPFTLNTTLPLPGSSNPIPALGFGVYQTPPEGAATAVTAALEAGYRHVDSAVFYKNEAGCGTALRESGIPREQLFFTSKVAPDAMSYAGAAGNVAATLAATQLGYVDLYLLHSPTGGREARLAAWRALVDAQRRGDVRAIGVSNFGVHHLRELAAHIREVDGTEGPGKGGVVAINQIEIHPWCRRRELVKYCEDNGILVQAWSPLVRNERMDDPVLKALAEKHGKSPAQILLRWSLQMVSLPCPLGMRDVTEY
jgi:diketogulonate reductase-like aldo/keto reductase